ncbi:prolipoprotein diacylglyceryl transferase, partial [Salmonella enterica subsp. enterica serovar Typhimurium]|nr:prolipoprotein diacylglyceryl transferase [Salmonella enterica subsp. enterica serovar Typhimurium]
GSGLYCCLGLTHIFTFRLFVENTKEIQRAFEAGLPMDMGQILSLPLIIAGVWSIASSPKRAAKKENKA